MTFETLGLAPALLRALADNNYNTPTPIQAEAIPLVLAGHDVLGGDLFLFVGRDRKKAKVLFFDGTGLCLLHKRLSKGLFAALWRQTEGLQLQLSRTELALFLEGSEAIGRIPLSPAPLERTELRRSRR